MAEVKTFTSDNSVLESLIRQGGQDAQLALEELSGRALGGNESARKIVNGLDTDFSSGVLTLPSVVPVENKGSFLSGFRNLVRNLLPQSDQASHLLPPDRDP